MPVLLTGATGFIGGRIARLLVARGEHVRCLVRKTSSLLTLEGLDVELATGDLRNPESLAAAVADCATIYHVAADYRLWSRDPRELYHSNVDGTRHLLAAAERAGCSRFVYCSSVGTLGIPTDGSPGTERTPVSLGDMVGHYKRSKFLAEQVALAAARRGVPVVIVNPSTPMGPGDVKPTQTGQIVQRFLQGRMPCYLATGLNLIHVDDVAEGHLLAAARGCIGEKYLLGNRNMTLLEILECLATITGRRAPQLELPYPVALGLASVNQFCVGTLLGREPGIPLEGVRMARRPMFFSAARAISELGLPQTPVEEALRQAVDWFTTPPGVRAARPLRTTSP